jgi:hypothetical protein
MTIRRRGPASSGGNKYSSYTPNNSNAASGYASASASASTTTTTDAATTATATTNDIATATTTATTATTDSTGGGEVVVPWKSFRNKPVESVEDRILGKVRGKINKIGESTYNATKGFMQQILDSGETDFLNEFMKFVFSKAATEPSFCSLYARLLHELADEFGHLRSEMCILFRDYTGIFTETENTPDVGTTDYKAFLEAQERKKFRRGYSQFVAELAKLGEVNLEDFRSLVEKIVYAIPEVTKSSDNSLISEEYVDCLSKMCSAGASIISKADWMADCTSALKKVVESSRTVLPGLTSKARFAIMDILDLEKKNWKI